MADDLSSDSDDLSQREGKEEKGRTCTETRDGAGHETGARPKRLAAGRATKLISQQSTSSRQATQKEGKDFVPIKKEEGNAREECAPGKSGTDKFAKKLNGRIAQEYKPPYYQPAECKRILSDAEKEPQLKPFHELYWDLVNWHLDDTDEEMPWLAQEVLLREKVKPKDFDDKERKLKKIQFWMGRDCKLSADLRAVCQRKNPGAERQDVVYVPQVKKVVHEPTSPVEDVDPDEDYLDFDPKYALPEAPMILKGSDWAINKTELRKSMRLKNTANTEGGAGGGTSTAAAGISQTKTKGAKKVEPSVGKTQAQEKSPVEGEKWNSFPNSVENVRDTEGVTVSILNVTFVNALFHLVIDMVCGISAEKQANTTFLKKSAELSPKPYRDFVKKTCEMKTTSMISGIQAAQWARVCRFIIEFLYFDMDEARVVNNRFYFWRETANMTMALILRILRVRTAYREHVYTGGTKSCQHRGFQEGDIGISYSAFKEAKKTGSLPQVKRECECGAKVEMSSKVPKEGFFLLMDGYGKSLNRENINRKLPRSIIISNIRYNLKAVLGYTANFDATIIIPGENEDGWDALPQPFTMHGLLASYVFAEDLNLK